jgi:hypothetical protein
MTRFPTVCLACLSVATLVLAPHATIAQPTEQEGSVRGKINKLASEPMKPAPGDDAVKKLLKDRYNTALDLLKTQMAGFAAGRENRLSSWVDSMEQVLRARRELTDKPADLIPLLELRFELAPDAESQAEALYRAGGLIDSAGPPAARIVRIDAEIDLLRMQKRAGTEKQP